MRTLPPNKSVIKSKAGPAFTLRRFWAQPSFAAIHLAAIRGIYPMNSYDLHASPAAPATRREAVAALASYFGVSTTDPIQLSVLRGWMAMDHRNWFHADLPFYWTDWREDQFPKPMPPNKAFQRDR